MRFVHDDQVEVPDAEATLRPVLLLDQPHHRRIGRDEDPALRRLVRQQVHGCRGRQVRLEGVHRLPHQRRAVGQEQDALGPVRPHQQVRQCDHGARLARPRRHHHQGPALPVRLERLRDAADGAVLVVALYDRLVGLGRRKGAPCGAPLHQQGELGFLVEALHRARRIRGVVPDPVLIAVGAEDYRALAVHGLQAVGIELGLVLALARVVPGRLGLDDGQRAAVITPQHVIDEALPGRVRHADDGVFSHVHAVRVPPGFAQQQVDEVVAGRGLVVVVCVRLGGVQHARRGHLGAELLQFRVQCGVAGQEVRQLLVTGAQLDFAGAELLERELGDGGHGRRQLGRVEGEAIGGFLATGVGACQPVGEVEQLGGGRAGLGVRERLFAMDGLVADVLEEAGLVKDRVADGGAEAGLVDQGGEVVLVGQL